MHRHQWCVANWCCIFLRIGYVLPIQNTEGQAVVNMETKKMIKCREVLEGPFCEKRKGGRTRIRPVNDGDGKLGIYFTIT
jgi:hypothetical protein